MKDTVTIQVHDYDRCGFYHIVEDREATREEVCELRKRAHDSVNADWDRLPKEAAHIVYYAEMLDNSGEPWFAAIYMHGEAYDDHEFNRIFCAPQIGLVGAIHRRITQ